MNVVDVLFDCPTCGDPAPPGATRCECGERLAPHAVAAAPAPAPALAVAPYGCTCGGNGVCLPCYFAELDGDA